MLENLKLLRKQYKLSQKTLGEKIGMSQQSINGYENDNIEPDISTLIKIANLFETSIDYIVGNTTIRNRIEEVKEYSLNQSELLHMENYRKLPINTRKIIDDFIMDKLNN